MNILSEYLPYHPAALAWSPTEAKQGGQYLDGRPPGKTRLLPEEVLVRPAGKSVNTLQNFHFCNQLKGLELKWWWENCDYENYKIIFLVNILLKERLPYQYLK